MSGGLVAGNVLTPLKPAAFAGPPPGIAADVVDDQGRPVRNRVGELVVRAPWIGMTRGFWRTRTATWRPTGRAFPTSGCTATGRPSTTTGCGTSSAARTTRSRSPASALGPAEVESVLVEHPAVLEAAAIGVPDELKGQALVCFCVLRPGLAGSEALAGELKALVARRLGKPLRPETVRFVTDLPKTRNAKVMRRVIRAAYLGEPPGDLSSLENPQAVTEIARAARGRKLRLGREEAETGERASREHRGYFAQSLTEGRVLVRRWEPALRAGTWIARCAGHHGAWRRLLRAAHRLDSAPASALCESLCEISSVNSRFLSPQSSAFSLPASLASPSPTQYTAAS